MPVGVELDQHVAGDRARADRPDAIVRREALAEVERERGVAPERGHVHPSAPAHGTRQDDDIDGLHDGLRAPILPGQLLPDDDGWGSTPRATGR